MGALILDASVLVELLDSADAHHRQAVDEVNAADHAGTQLRVPASAYSEALVPFARADRANDARQAIAAGPAGDRRHRDHRRRDEPADR